MAEPSPAPLVSVVIPTYNRPAQLARCLASIEMVRRPGPIEVVVVDDGSPTPLEPVVAPHRATVGATLVRQPNAGPGAARNTGVTHARGRIIVFLDDDCTFEEETLVQFVDALREAPGAIVGGRTRNGLPGNPFATASQAIVDSVYAYYNREPTDARFFATNNMAVERSAFLASEGFDDTFVAAAEDRDFCDRWRHSGGRLVYHPGAVVVHAHDLTFGDYVRQHRAYGRGAYIYHRRRACRGSGRIRDDLGFHAELAGQLLASARRFPAGTALRGAALAAVWQVANASGWAEAATSDGRRRLTRQLARHGTRPA